MSRTKTYAPLHVFMNDRAVGVLTKYPDGATVFLYDPWWLEWEGAMPVSLSLPLQDRGHSGAAVISCLLYTSPSPRDRTRSRMPSSA